MKQSTNIMLIVSNILFWAFILMIGFYYEWESPPFSTAEGTYTPTLLFGNFFNAIVVYVHALILYPNRKSIRLPYWFCVLLLILLTAIAEALIDYRLVFHFDLAQQLDQNLGHMSRYWFIIISFFQNTVIHFFWLILSFAIVFYYESSRNQQIQEALKEEKLTAELKYLRAQINPHFLFNGINSAYFLIDEKPEIAKSTLLKFSDLLRYQLYECQDDSIALQKELNHVQSYIDMERIRKGEDVQINIDLPDTVSPLQISPLLFTPFLENAFKYVSNHDDGNQNIIDIKIRLDENKLYFETENTVDKNRRDTQGGIGLQNVKKRLALLYPDKHDLHIFEKEDRFVVRLHLELNHEYS